MLQFEAETTTTEFPGTKALIHNDHMLRMEKKHKLPTLKLDQAYLTVNSSLVDPVNLYTQNVLCDGCPLVYQGHTVKGVLNIVANTTNPTIINVVDSRQSETICSFHYHFGEHGNYSLNVFENEKQQRECQVTVTEDPVNIYIPLLIAACVYFGLGILWILFSYITRKEFFRLLWKKEPTPSLDIQVEFSGSQQVKLPKKERLKSLDTFRGIAIVVMIFVNYGGGDYWFFDHALWNGLTVADLVFPWFIWIMGVSMALSMRSLLRKAIPRKKIFLKILKRSIILFLLGLILNTHGGHNDLSRLRIPGVLQRFSISYFVVATVHLFFAQPNHIDQSVCNWLRDVTLYWVEWLIMLVILMVHILLTFLLDVPGCPKGYLGPGGLHDNISHPLCTGGAAGYIDRVVLGETHIYQNPTCKLLYDTSLPYDPEGILGCLTSIFLVFLGLQAGKILLTYQLWLSRVIRWCIWGVITGGIAALLCQASTNDGWIPVNKNLWSVSFILATGSMAFLLLTFCYLVIDIMKWWSGAPLYQPGMNSILLYVGHSLVHGMFPWAWKPSETHWEHLLMNLWGTTLWVLIAIWLHCKKFFLAL